VANSQSVCTSFKQELLQGIHAFGTTVIRGGTTADTFSAALYLATGTLGAATTAYSATNEVSGTNYVAGGITVTNAVTPTTSGTTAYWTPSANFSWTNVTLSVAFNAVLLYNSTQSNRAVAVYVFGNQTVTAGNFTLTMPTNAAATALLQLN
jgi:hypothetical protein